MLMLASLAVALAVDAAIVSAGLGAAGIGRGALLVVALVFGLFQAGMAALGALGGDWLMTFAAAWDHWLAAGLLALIGGRMLLARQEDGPPGPLSVLTVLTLAVATSIDALAAGMTLPLLPQPLAVSSSLIGAVTVALCVLAGTFGQKLSAWAGKNVERLGGVVLIGVGLSILYQHLMGV